MCVCMVCLHMYMCMYVCVCEHVHMCLCVCVCECMHMCVCVYVCVYVCVHVCVWGVPLHIRLCVPLCMHVWMKKSTFSADSLKVPLQPTVQSHASTSVCMLKIPNSLGKKKSKKIPNSQMLAAIPLFGRTQLPHTHTDSNE